MMKSLLHHVLDHAERNGDGLCVRTVSRRQPEGALTWGQLREAAGRAAAAWQARGVRAGDLVVLVGTHHLDFYAVWLGALWVGAVPTVLAEPSVRIDHGLYWQRLGALLERLQARHLAHDPRYAIDAGWPALLAHSNYEEIAAGAADTPPLHEPRAQDLMLLQHSSGTTGLQKGIMLSHGAVLRHAEDYQAALAMTGEDVVASWLPLYHDMGLIACLILPLLVGAPVLWLSPFEWVGNPALLLEAASEHRATLLWLPNFAFAFLADRVRPDTDFDLGSLRAVINCSEPVTEEALERFAGRFAGEGLRRDSLHTCYAMAENVFAVTATSPAAPPRVLRVDRAAWQQEHRAVPASGEDAVTLVSSGSCLPGCRLRVVDAAGAALAAGQVGRILIRTPYLFDGYFRRPELNEALFDADGFFDTGDLGFVDGGPDDDAAGGGHLFVTGRAKDLIIVGGRNVYPQDVEVVAGGVEGVHPGRVVCFGLPLPHLGTEGLVVLAESSLGPERWPAVARRIRAAVPAQLDLDLFDVRVQPQGRLRKSTSGKLARDGNREWYLAGRFGPPPAALVPAG